MDQYLFFMKLGEDGVTVKAVERQEISASSTPRIGSNDLIVTGEVYDLVTSNLDAGFSVQYVNGDFIRVRTYETARRECLKELQDIEQAALASFFDEATGLSGIEIDTQQLALAAVVGVPYEHDHQLRVDPDDARRLAHTFIQYTNRVRREIGEFIELINHTYSEEAMQGVVSLARLTLLGSEERIWQ